MMQDPSAAGIAAHYGDLLKGLVIERGDHAPGRVFETDTVMGDRARLAREVLGFAETLL
jgi:hypothetical protein